MKKIIFLCEGTLDMEVLSRILQDMRFNKVNIKDVKSYAWKELGLKIGNYRVLRKDSILSFIFYPEGGGYYNVIRIAKDSSQQIKWKKEYGIEKIALAVDLDDKNVEERLNAVMKSLKSSYHNVEKVGSYSFKCIHKGYEFIFTVVPLGDPKLGEKININFVQLKFMVEDLIINSIIEDKRWREICIQGIEFFKHKAQENPDQKSLIRIAEAFCQNKEIYELIKYIKAKKLPDHVKLSIEEALQV